MKKSLSSLSHSFPVAVDEHHAYLQEALLLRMCAKHHYALFVMIALKWVQYCINPIISTIKTTTLEGQLK